MSNAVIFNKIQEKIQEIGIEEKAIIVLKGIPLSVVDDSVEKIDLKKIVDNKMGYFMSIYGNRKYLTYEEFLLMSDFVVSQYKYVYILNNNIYMEQYPVEECFPDDIRKGILNHFEESEDEENDDSYIEHEATVSKISDEQLFYLMSRGISEKEATQMIIMGFIEPFSRELPMEYAVELNQLIKLDMEGSVG